MSGPSIIDQRTGISIAVACTFGSALFLAGNYMGKVDQLDRMNIPKELASIRADLGVIKSRLGIPNASATLFHQTFSAPPATAIPMQRQPMQPLQAATAEE